MPVIERPSIWWSSPLMVMSPAGTVPPAENNVSASRRAAPAAKQPAGLSSLALVDQLQRLTLRCATCQRNGPVVCSVLIGKGSPGLVVGTAGDRKVEY